MSVKMFVTQMGMFIGKVVEEKEDSYIIENPRMISADVHNPNKLSFVPFPPFAKEDSMEVFKNAILVEPYDILEDLETQYIEAITGISVVKTSGKSDEFAQVNESKAKTIFHKLKTGGTA